MNVPEGDARSFLLALIGDSVVNMKKAVKLMDNTEDTKRKTVRITAVQYRVTTVKYTCTHCHAVNSVEKTLNTKTESFSYIGHDKQVYIVNWKSLETPVVINAIMNTCDACEAFVDTLSREELTQRYMNSIKRVPLDTKPVIKKQVPEIDYSELDLDSEYNIIQEGVDVHGRELERIIEERIIEEPSNSNSEHQVLQSGLSYSNRLRADSDSDAGCDGQDEYWQGQTAPCSSFQSTC